jgi:8-oxo-dGTP pyrophosphatase MutT (NUDIX family)
VAVVVAAGAVVIRQGAGAPEVLCVHRPRYDDWSLPKGKSDRGDVDAAATARREVLEETGLIVVLGAQLDSVTYTDRLGRDKIVHYWKAHVVGGEFAANDEVDRIDWLDFEMLAGRLTYPRDVDVVASALGVDRAVDDGRT